MFRIKPGIDAHTHSFIRTGQIDSKFGLALETGEALEACVKRSKWSAFIFAACTATSAPRFLILILSSTRPR